MKALVVIDYINEIANKEGKLAGKGYYDFIIKNNTFENLNKLLDYARKNDFLLIFVKVGFSKDYVEQPKKSLLFGKANEFGALKLDTWATEFCEELDILKNDIVIVKNRVSAFYNTNLELIFRNNDIKDVFVAGVATDLAVSNIVREGHDRDYNMIVVEDCCAAGSEEDHNNSLKILKKIAIVKELKYL